MIAPQPHPFSLFQMNNETYILKNMLELWGITTLTDVIVRGSECLYWSQSWDNKCHILCPEGVNFNMWTFMKVYQICRSSRSNTINQSGLFVLICALTSYILEVSRGKVPEIVFARICNPFAKSLCAYTSRRRDLPYWYGFARIRGSTFLKLALVEDSIESRSQRIEICPDDNCCTLFPLVSFLEVSHMRFLTRQ